MNGIDKNLYPTVRFELNYAGGVVLKKLFKKGLEMRLSVKNLIVSVSCAVGLASGALANPAAATETTPAAPAAHAAEVTPAPATPVKVANEEHGKKAAVAHTKKAKKAKKKAEHEMKHEGHDAAATPAPAETPAPAAEAPKTE